MKSRVNILAIFFIFISMGCVGSFDQTDYEFDYGFETEANIEASEASEPAEQAVVPVFEDPTVEEEVVLGEEEIIEEEEVVEEEEVPDPNERPAPGSVVVFEIPAGTGNQSWNSKETPVVAYVGQVLLIVNNDNETHQLHVSGGGPTNHGQPMGAGGSQEFELNAASPLKDSTPFYDHSDGRSAGFWLEIRP